MLRTLAPITLALTAVAVVQPPMLQAQKGKSPENVPVVSNILNTDPAIAPVMHIQSDGAPYTDSRTVESQIQGIGDWELTLGMRGSTRWAYLSFASPILGTGPAGGNPVAPPDGLYQLRFLVQCHQDGQNMLSMALGTTFDCRLFGSFNHGGQLYKIAMNQAGPYSETEHVRVECVAADLAGTCRNWSITPTGSVVLPDGVVARSNVIRLSIEKTVKGWPVQENQGNFYMSFSIALSR